MPVFKIAENLLKSGSSIKFTRSISFTQGDIISCQSKLKQTTSLTLIQIAVNFAVPGQILEKMNKLAGFYSQNNLKKCFPWKMVIEQIIELQLRGLVPTARTSIPTTG